jgi:hypothetical protein
VSRRAIAHFDEESDTENEYRVAPQPRRSCAVYCFVSGPFLDFLGASATVVGIISGSGELVGHATRFASGWVGDRTQC